jgi:hypothetical protein
MSIMCEVLRRVDIVGAHDTLVIHPRYGKEYRRSLEESI